MSVINRRNAVFGYTVLKVLERRRKQRRRSTARIALYVGLGVVSAGILAGLAVLVRRHRDDAGEHADTVVEGGHVVSEPSATVSEPLPAT
ncbi:MAG: hypothetical protein H0U30_06815 [Actinobacteria bacterium]|nr:hypothetical protein [Actinomycetota bacterium]